MKKRRLVLATVFSPWAASLILFLLAVLLPLDSSSAGLSRWNLLMMLWLIFGSYAGVLTLGLPAYWFLKRVGKLSLPALAFVGGFGGVAACYGIVRLLGAFLGSSSGFNAGQLIWGSVLGFVVALIFGLIAGVPLQKHEH